MKHIIYMALGLMTAAALTGCSDDMELPPMVSPQAPTQVVKGLNTTIAQLKQDYWANDRNYVKTIGQTPDGEDIIIAGRVTSSDETGNIYKTLVVEDATGAITIAVNAKNLYETYKQGQEIYIRATGLNIGGYNGLMQIGGAGTYNNAPSMTQMDEAVFTSHAFAQGMPNVDKIDTAVVTISELANIKSQPVLLCDWQSKLIRIDNVEFVTPGVEFTNGSKNADVYVKDADGQKLNLRMSAYATFSRQIAPAGHGSVTGILSYYGSDWQMLIIDMDAFGGNDWDWTYVKPKPEPGEGSGDGSSATPYTVSDVIGGGASGTAWVTGYVVGWIDGKTIADGARFNASATSATNLLLAPDPACQDVNLCIPLQLPTGEVRTALNLMDNAANLGRQLTVYGSIEKYFGVPGVKTITQFNFGPTGK